MAPDFAGDVATHYARYRRGYPPAAVDVIVRAFGITGEDLVVDLGCGTGQLTVPLAARAGTVVGVDPEPDMLAIARRHPVANVRWQPGTDRDLADIAAGRSLAAVTAAVAIHWMDRDALFRAARPLLREGGGIAIVTNGAPLWLQDTDWSRTVNETLAEWVGHPVDDACQTDGAGRARTRDALRHNGYRVVEETVDYTAALSFDQLVGGLISAMPPTPPARRHALTDRLRERLGGEDRFTEHVTVHIQCGHTPATARVSGRAAGAGRPGA
jgi:SAM-dependent methyltransferase